jgi:hypothetical protein
MALITQGRSAKQRSMGRMPLQPDASPDEKSQIAEFVERALNFVPTEIIGAYIALSGAISPNRQREKWIIYGVCVVLIPPILIFAAKTVKGIGTKVSYRITRLSVLGVASFTAWVAALAGGPFMIFGESTPRWGTGTLIVLGLMLPRLAEYWDLA